VDQRHFLNQLEIASEALISLESTLTDEFKALENKDFETFQGLQADKVSLLKEIQAFDKAKNDFLLSNANDPNQSLELESLLSNEDSQKWLGFLNGLKNCDQLHRKIDFYLTQKIKITTEILDILQVNTSHNATKLYDAYGNNKLSTIGNKISEA